MVHLKLDFYRSCAILTGDRRQSVVDSTFEVYHIILQNRVSNFPFSSKTLKPLARVYCLTDFK